ncbi:MAG: hypothetical protein C0399_09435 [Syntrophus sp. (in: bacteria)]|nr:hypothetical protein [Syntrophus sp. (in: bacteria)]
MERISKIGIEKILENFQTSGKAEILTVKESSKIKDSINNNMEQFKIEFKKIEFESKVAAEKIVLTMKK